MSNTSSYPDPQVPDGQGSSGLFVQSHENHNAHHEGDGDHQDQTSLVVADTTMHESDAHTLERLSQSAYNMEQQMIAQGAMDLQNHPAHDYMPSSHDGQLLASARKRSKVSRACDECRRKKIRCDATGENGPESCTSCKRSGNSCQFSRQPLKRGPSKGYIKELADRVKLIEKNISAPSSSPGVPMSTGAQRVYSPPRASSQSASDSITAFTNPFPATTRPSVSPMSGYGPDEEIMSRNSNLNDMEQAYTFQLYTSHLQAVLQFLPDEPTELNIRLSLAPTNLRQAFCGAAECLLHTFGHNTQQQYDPQEMSTRASRFLDAAQYDCDDLNPTFTLSNHVMYLVSLVMMIVQADQRHSPLGMSRPGELIGRAVGRSNSLSLDDDLKLIEGGHRLLNFGRRVYGALFILDRHHAFSFSSQLTLPLNSQSFIKTYESIVSQRETTLLMRIADSIGLYAHILKSQVPSAQQDPTTNLLAHSTVAPFLGSSISSHASVLDTFQLPENSVLHLTLHHAELAAARQTPLAQPAQILHLTNRLLAPLLEPSTPISPLHVHFARLAATSLVELSKHASPVGTDAQRAIDTFLSALTSRPVVPILPDGSGWDQHLYKILAVAKAGTSGNDINGGGSATDQISGLQSLAEAAVTESHRPGSSADAGDGSEVQAARAQATAAAAAATLAGGIEGGLDKALLEFIDR